MSEPSVRALLLADLDELLAAVTRALDHIWEVTEPERAKACRTAIAITRVGLMEIHDRAHARPLDEDAGLNSDT
jgi:hypothetical protein